MYTVIRAGFERQLRDVAFQTLDESPQLHSTEASEPVCCKWSI